MDEGGLRNAEVMAATGAPARYGEAVAELHVGGAGRADSAGRAAERCVVRRGAGRDGRRADGGVVSRGQKAGHRAGMNDGPMITVAAQDGPDALRLGEGVQLRRLGRPSRNLQTLPPYLIAKAKAARSSRSRRPGVSTHPGGEGWA